jgi:hypothetical protein
MHCQQGGNLRAAATKRGGATTALPAAKAPNWYESASARRNIG